VATTPSDTMTKHKHERTGELLILSQSVLFGLFPVILSYSGGKIPPLFFAAVTTFISGTVIFLYLLYTKKWHELFIREAYKPIAWLTLFVVIGYSFVFIGGSKTSGINISVLAQGEILFTFLISGFIFREKMPFRKIIAAAGVLIGSLLIVFNGTFTPNPADLMILVATIVFPFGNRNAQKAMELVSPQTVLTIRSFLSAFAYLFLSFWLEDTLITGAQEIRNNVPIILVNGLLIFSVTKIMWYEGLKRLDLSKAVTLGMTYTAFGFLYSIILLSEQPTYYQISGLILVMLGAYWITRKDKRVEDHLIENI